MKCLFAFALIVGSCTLYAAPAPLPAVAAVDLARPTGGWYEIALLPSWFQRACVADQPVLVGTPRRDYAWVLSRTPQMAEADL